MIALSFIAVFLLISLLWQLFRWGILWNPSSLKVLSVIDQELRQYIDVKQASFVDLGSGIGTTLWFFHRKGWARVTGIEGFFPVFVLSILCKFFLKLSSVDIRKGDYRLLPVKGEVLFAYTCPKDMKQMRCWLQEKKPQFDWLVTHTFSVPGAKPYCVKYAQDLYTSPVYFYKRSQMFDQPID